ncbi:MAG: FAD-dependent monooxygenase [Ottowia sp.]|nr:FAD-dependent monooxygenase [Ottowia sp.]
MANPAFTIPAHNAQLDPHDDILNLSSSNHLTNQYTDIALIGAGPVGLALAGWLLRDSPWHITLIDTQPTYLAPNTQLSTPARATQNLNDNPTEKNNSCPPHPENADPRTIALAAGSALLLHDLHAWPTTTTPIYDIHVSQQGHFGRTHFTYTDYGNEALGHVTSYVAIQQALGQALRQQVQDHPRFRWWTSSQVTHTSDLENGVLLNIKGAHTEALHAKLVIHAEGGLFKSLPLMAQPNLFQKLVSHIGTAMPPQTAVLATVTCQAPKPHWAWERFTQEGPLALLPTRLRCGTPAFSLVWIAPTSISTQRMTLSDSDFLQALNHTFGTRMGTFQSVQQRLAYPLHIRSSANLVQGRHVAIGNAAQALHPVAGQGLNLGLRDAWTLAHTLRQSIDDPTLAQFAQRRYIDRQRTQIITSTLPSIFSSEFTPVEWGRTLALTACGLFPTLRHTLAHQMMFGSR